MEKYQITKEDRIRIRPQPNMLKVSGDQIFATLQGEGVTAGGKAVFLRLHYCNLACGKDSGWKCDTGYTWDKDRPEFWQEPQDWTYQETVEKIKSLWDQEFGKNCDDKKRVVITGGEPLLQQRKIVEVAKLVPDWQIEIETNGTINPLPELSNCQINCSPKLENSGNPRNRRYRPDVLRGINELPNSWFKFVVVGTPDLDEISQVVTFSNLSSQKILIMPEGQTLESTTSHLLEIEEEVDKRGWKITKRNQLEWFGNKRRT